MSSQLMEVKVPDIGDTKDVPVIEVHVKAGDLVALDQALITLESDKATMDIPSPAAGVVQTVQLKVGERASEGMTVLMLKPNASSAIPTDQPSAASDLALSTNNAASPPTSPPIALSLASATSTAPSAITVAAPATVANYATETPVSATQSLPTSVGHASPSVRKFARELGVDISKVSGSGPKGRVTQNDVQLFVKNAMQGQHEHGNPITRGSSDLNLLPWPKIDFSKFGPIQVQALPRIKKLSAANLARNWVMIPAVTYHEEADITELEAFRLRVNKEQEKSGIKLTALAFLIKICAVALKKFPEFNASLDGDNLVLKQYMHIGFAADTPNGLLVPVIRDVDRKGVLEIAGETATLAQLAREGKLKSEQMQGACFTISSVGGIGGTGFAPIVNAPEVAILGVSKSAYKPVWDSTQFVPRLIMPLSLTADHRVIDGAMATRFNAYIAQLLNDFRRVML